MMILVTAFSGKSRFCILLASNGIMPRLSTLQKKAFFVWSYLIQTDKLGGRPICSAATASVISKPHRIWKYKSWNINFTHVTACLDYLRLRKFLCITPLRRPKNKNQWPNAADQPNLVVLKPSRAELLQLYLWSNFSENLDLCY